jgi:hypothetical protein
MVVKSSLDTSNGRTVRGEAVYKTVIVANTFLDGKPQVKIATLCHGKAWKCAHECPQFENYSLWGVKLRVSKCSNIRSNNLVDQRQLVFVSNVVLHNLYYKPHFTAGLNRGLYSSCLLKAPDNVATETKMKFGNQPSTYYQKKWAEMFVFFSRIVGRYLINYVLAEGVSSKRVKGRLNTEIYPNLPVMLEVTSKLLYFIYIRRQTKKGRQIIGCSIHYDDLKGQLLEKSWPFFPFQTIQSIKIAKKTDR